MFSFNEVTTSGLYFAFWGLCLKTFTASPWFILQINCWHFSMRRNIFMNEIEIIFSQLTSNFKELLRTEKNSGWLFWTFGFGQMSPFVDSTQGPGLERISFYFKLWLKYFHYLSYRTGQFLNSSPPCSARITLRKILSKITGNILMRAGGFQDTIILTWKTRPAKW